MKKINKEHLENIIIILLLAGLIIYGIVAEELKIVVTCGLLIVSYFVINLIMIFSLRSLTRQSKLEQKYYNELAKRDNLSIFEQVKLLAYEDKLDDLIRNKLKDKKIKNVLSLETDVNGIDKAMFWYRFNGFEVIVNISNDIVTYQIDSPANYEYLSDNHKFEEEKKEFINLNNYNSITEIIDDLVKLVLEINGQIEVFQASHTIDQTFNGRLLKKIENLRKCLKTNGLGLVILSPILLFGFSIMLYFGITDFEYREENPIGYTIFMISIVLFLAFIIFSLFIGIWCLKTLCAIKKDIQEKSIEKITVKPKNVKIIAESLGKHSIRRVLRFIYIVTDDCKLIIPFSNNHWINKSVRKCAKECEKITAELTYLKTSKVVISGYSKYIGVVKRELLNEGFD